MAGYGDDSGFAAWLTANGLTLPTGAPAPAVLRERGSGYVDGTYGGRFPGTPTGGYAQERAWPRSGALDRWGSEIPADVVPVAAVNASYAAGYQEAASPGSLAASLTPGAAIKRKKVASLEVEYFEAPGPADACEATPVFTQIEGLLAPILLALLPYPTVV